MALITCPECGKEISDKSDKCIHCGYPIRNKPYIGEEVCGVEYDVSFLIDNGISKIDKIAMVKKLMDCDLKTAKDIVDKYCPVNKVQINMPKCPICGSANIQVVPRKWSMLTGFRTNKTDRICVNCKHKY